jgi:hypothetical protein
LNVLAFSTAVEITQSQLSPESRGRSRSIAVSQPIRTALSAIRKTIAALPQNDCGQFPQRVKCNLPPITEEQNAGI